MPKLKNPNKEIWCTCLGRRSWVKDSKGWWVHTECMKPSRWTLNECDICDKPHRDSIQGFPFATTCAKCEAAL